MLLPELVAEPVVVVPVLVEWFRLVPILLPAILPLARVSGHVLASVPPVSFPNPAANHRAMMVFIIFPFCCIPDNYSRNASIDNNPQSKFSPSYVVMIKLALFLGIL